MMEIAWTIHAIADEDPPPMYAVLANDDSRGLIVGEMPEVQALANRLAAFVAAGEHDGEISDLDPQLGVPWLTVAEAAREWRVPRSSITLACRQGLIGHAEKSPRGWAFPQRSFLGWLAKRPGRGRRTK